ncbi:hypothetical protein AN217_24330 [Streptomyces qinglanensis]|uniref:HD domain-containing protein n=1 Tax=Streptomyces qinglanensis TaxID=943816 RepID=A0A1E7K908_9ACTN|nr:hypothetical protein [Streptomyces qinglanensis]OEV00411.1 hypothetical protein AN217_24330 [Streptomyces qinglanensis]
MTRTTAARLVAACNAAAALVVCGALGSTLWRGLARPGTALVFGLLVAAGELARVRLPEERAGVRTTGLLSGAAALGYALCGQVAGTSAGHGPAQAVAVAAVGSLVGLTPLVALGQAPPPQALARLVLGVGAAALCCQPLYGGGRSDGAAVPDGLLPLCLLSVALLVGCLDALLAAAALRADASGAAPAGHHGRAGRHPLRSHLATVPALAATAVLFALAVAAAGLPALPLCCAPVLVVQCALRRRASARATHRPTLASLARAPEVAGCTPRGHARRVADLSRAVGRELGLTGGELTALEYAALTHDVGQLSPADPVPGGATAVLDAGSQRRVALLGGAVLRQAGVRRRVASAVEAQADPYREQPVTARVLRTVNAYDDLVGDSGTAGAVARARALHRLRAAGRDHEPRVVEALSRVVARAAEV